MIIWHREAYTEGPLFQVEGRTVFATEWLPVALAGQIPTPGDYAAHAIGGWPVLAVRGADGTVRTFRNVCRHQRMPVAEKAEGRCTELRCRTHGWTYDLEGRFATAPIPVAPADRSSPDNHLRAVETTVLRDIVLCTFHPLPLPATLGEVDLLIARELGAARPRHAGALTAEIGGNWKVCIEHALSAPDDTVAWHWPLLLARPHAAGVVVEQIVPLTFLRTRVVRHLLVPEFNTASTAALLQPEAAAATTACEALQAERAAGTFASSHARVEVFHERLIAACGADRG